MAWLRSVFLSILAGERLRGELQLVAKTQQTRVSAAHRARDAGKNSYYF